MSRTRLIAILSATGLLVAGAALAAPLAAAGSEKQAKTTAKPAPAPVDYAKAKAKVLESCRAKTLKKGDLERASAEEKRAFAKCLHNGLRALKEKAIQDREKARAKLIERLRDSRELAGDKVAKALETAKATAKAKPTAKAPTRR